MGRTKLIIVISIFSFLSNTLDAQNKVFGFVKDSSNLGISNVAITLKKGTENLTTSYTFSDEKGFYQISDIPDGTYNLIFNSMVFEEQKIEILLENNESLKKDIRLNIRTTYLDEVLIESKSSIEIKKDTIVFQVNRFLKGNEQTVQDILKNIPGLEVDAEGTIRVNGREVEKVMVEGDDFLDKGYRILTKNMPSQPIEEVELLRNYSNNRLLKGIEKSDKVALNLKLNEESKRIWFGNVEAGIGNGSFYDLRGNLMNFGKKNKYYFLTNLNSIGYDATGDVEHLVKPYRINEPASIGDDQKVSSLIDLNSSGLNFKKSKTNFNNSELISLNAIFNPTEKIKIKTLGFFNWDEINFFRNTRNTVSINTTNFTNTEDYSLSKKNKIAFGKIDFIYNISNTKMLESSTKYNNAAFNDGSNLVFNDNSTIESLEHENLFFDQKISYTNKFKKKKVFILTGRLINEKTPQDYSINKFLYQDLFQDFNNTNNVIQKIDNQMQFAGFDFHLLDRKENDNLFELQFGNEYRRDKLKTSFSLLDNQQILDVPEGYQNQTIYQVNNLYASSKYLLKINNLSIIGKLDAHQFFNRLSNNSNSKNQNPFFLNPSIGIDWEINKKNKIISSYAYNTTNAEVLDVYSDFILKGFRSFSKGTADFNQLTASSLALNYKLGNWSDRFFTNTLILFKKNHDFFSTQTAIEQNYTQSTKILIKDRSYFSISSKFDYYFKRVSTNLKLDVGYSKNEFKNIINNSDLRKVTSNNYNYGLELRSGFNGFFNYHIGTKWSKNDIEATFSNSFTNNISFLDLSFIFNDVFDIQFQSERYHFRNLSSNKNYLFLDFDMRYKINKDKLVLTLNGNNLLNLKKFRNFSISDIGNTTTEYRLLPRFILLKMEYRF